MQILRYDSQPESRATEIAADWRGWLDRNGYVVFSTAEVNAAGLALTLDVYQRDTLGDDAYALYHPSFRPGGLRESLYLLPDADAMHNVLMRAQQMAAMMMTAEAMRRERDPSAEG